MQKRTFKTIW